MEFTACPANLAVTSTNCAFAPKALAFETAVAMAVLRLSVARLISRCSSAEKYGFPSAGSNSLGYPKTAIFADGAAV